MSRVGHRFFRSSYYLFFAPRCIGRAGARKRRRVILLLSVGWLPPDLPPSGACLHLGTRILLQASERHRGVYQPGAASVLMHVGHLLSSGCRSDGALGLWVLPEPVWPSPT